MKYFLMLVIVVLSNYFVGSCSQDFNMVGCLVCFNLGIGFSLWWVMLTPSNHFNTQDNLFLMIICYVTLVGLLCFTASCAVAVMNSNFIYMLAWNVKKCLIASVLGFCIAYFLILIDSKLS